jgi:hypothetical protein
MGFFLIYHPKLTMDVQYFVYNHVIIKKIMYDICKIKLHFKISITNLQTIFEVDACRQEKQQWLH